MVRFIAGIVACLLAQAVGLDTITAGIGKVDRTVRAAYHTSAAQLAEKGSRK